MKTSPGKAAGYTHGEAFCLMWYRCQICPRTERLWNSRDGVTPFGINCPDCKGTMLHVDWNRDECVPNFTPHEGQRIFRDGTDAEARRYCRERLEKCRGTDYELPEAEWPAMIDGMVGEGSSEFLSGWPMIEVWLREARPLPSERAEKETK